MIDQVLQIHAKTMKQYSQRDPDAQLMKNGKITVSDFVAKWYETFDLVARSRLLILNHELSTTTTALRFVDKLKDSTNQKNMLALSARRPKSARVDQRRVTPRPSTARRSSEKTPRRHTSDEYVDNRHISFVNSLRSY